MDKDRILKEAQRIARKFSFWMVSGNVSHLYGHVYETKDIKYEMEIKFDENFPQSPPKLIYHDAIKELLGDFQLKKLKNWNPDSFVVDIINEIKIKILDKIGEPKIIEEEPVPTKVEKTSQADSEEYITPDLNAYPMDPQDNDYVTPSSTDDYSYEAQSDSSIGSSSISDPSTPESSEKAQEGKALEIDETSIAASEELGLIQQEYAYDQKGSQSAEINIYLTITVAKTFIIEINFIKYPEKPEIIFPNEVKDLLGVPEESLDTLKKWNPKKPPHIIDIIHELERKLFFIQDIELELKKILGEYQCDKVSNSMTQLKVHLLTYGFKEYLLDIDLGPYPKHPKFNLTPELTQIIQVPIESLKSHKSWKEKESEPVEILRELSWLVDKNSRMNFEIDLLKEHYKNINYDSTTETIKIDMKGKMKTQDLTFQFEIDLPRDYPMTMPEIKVLNEFELETQEKIKNDLQTSFNDFFKEWTPFKYLVDLFNKVSEKIFEVSVVSCVICHKIECPTCSLKIAGSESCHVSCPHCERSYHTHCWMQTIQSFGKCGFCLRTPPADANF